MSDHVTVAFKLHQAQKRETTRRSQGLPPIEVGLHFVANTASGIVRKGLRGEVVCEIDGGKFDVFVTENAIIKWLEKNGVKWRGERLNQGDHP